MTDAMPAIRNILGMPMPEIDYLDEAKKKAADAEFLVSDSPYMAGTVAEGRLLAAIAQAEFTEALVEQARIRNLLAYLTIIEEVPGPEDERQIREALGLA
ncbi:hypothetical protein [Cryobacterium arcticum]|uniref:Uncharacterized protein n=1 Tax=Cryobacterium arcticum TaxID=670052 RepID=A0A1B1BPR6_9MICO|nr:hypothetical protein [Cryobacterium arcticum]ANP74501.1 hypothetical protein PA27867_3579 [Cryobacterium arcticum]